MSHCIKSFRILLVVSVIFLALAQGLTPREVSAGEECKVLLQQKCVTCHFVKYICPKIEKNSGLIYWKWTLHSMIKEGAMLSDQEEKQLVDCLTNPDAQVKTLCPVKK